MSHSVQDYAKKRNENGSGAIRSNSLLEFQGQRIGGRMKEGIIKKSCLGSLMTRSDTTTDPNGSGVGKPTSIDQLP